jgi:hypothetical protein
MRSLHVEYVYNNRCVHHYLERERWQLALPPAFACECLRLVAKLLVSSPHQCRMSGLHTQRCIVSIVELVFLQQHLDLLSSAEGVPLCLTCRPTSNGCATEARCILLTGEAHARQDQILCNQMHICSAVAVVVHWQAVAVPMWHVAGGAVWC